MVKALVRSKPVVEETKPQTQNWKQRLLRPWSTYCDTRAVVAVVSLLNCLPANRCAVSVLMIVDFINDGDHSDLPVMRRADIREAFSGRHDTTVTVELLVAYLASEYVLFPEWHHLYEGYRVNRNEIPTLNGAHAHIDRGSSSTPHLKVV